MNSTIIPCLTYPDADAAIAWLKQVLGFAEHAVYRNEAGVIHHGELTHGPGMIMLGTGEPHPPPTKSTESISSSPTPMPSTNAPQTPERPSSSLWKTSRTAAARSPARIPPVITGTWAVTTRGRLLNLQRNGTRRFSHSSVSDESVNEYFRLSTIAAGLAIFIFTRPKSALLS